VGAVRGAIGAVLCDHSATILLATLLVWVALRAVRPTLHAGDGLTASYFTNTEWQGLPVLVGTDAEPSTATITERWHGAAPDRFSVQWTGFLAVSRTDWYTFSTTSDDGSELRIDNRLVVDNRGPHSLSTRSGSMHLERGAHLVILRYAQYGADYALDWAWARPGELPARIPTWALSEQKTSYARVTVRRAVDLVMGGLVAIAVIATGAYVVGGPIGAAAARLADRVWRELTHSYVDAASLVFSALVFGAVLWMPWPDAGPQRFYQSVAETLRDLNRTARGVVFGDFRTFRDNINRSQPTEDVLPGRVQEVMAIIRKRGIERYDISDSIAADDWVRQQIIASAWPRKREKSARSRFLLKSEPVAPECRLVDGLSEVSLVECH
jgi:hypothetical protein